MFVRVQVPPRVQSNPQPSLRVFLLQQPLKIIFIFEKTNLTMRYIFLAFRAFFLCTANDFQTSHWPRRTNF